ncbi:ATP-binding cassette sub-family G member 5 [Frankliniella fusca]|uniref:ATP-binding cassette sub-family G member 5 n=1 Tax=Frankliniella fusca TaxID=407009 RepID=A0AAE1HZD4_9NEOP|nr:ATP-binding cassette sub-family G member 5 [Frankliniella fusca]
MVTNEISLELCNVFHTGQVEPGTCLQRLLGSVKTGVILKDVSLEVHGGEVLAILGSKGSGKRALLDVVARREQGPTRGQILLNGVPMSLRLFQQSCAYVSHKCDVLPGLTAEQALHYAASLTIGSRVSRYMRSSRVKQVLADLALTQVANRTRSQLTASEYRRLSIGLQLIRDPVVLLLDEPTWDLDPLNTYLVVSILSNHARKYGRAVVLTMEKPRSDVFPFLDRVAYLCLGDMVYTGPTRFMLDYFRGIGFPCPELENPLMYYLCLSTVDRRSRDRFIESNHQIAALVDKFKLEGTPFRKSASSGAVLGLGDGGVGLGGTLTLSPVSVSGSTMGASKVPLSAFGRPSALRVALALYMRCLASTFNLQAGSIWRLASRLLLLPLYFCTLWLFYHDKKAFQHTFVTSSGLIFNMLAGTYFISIINTIFTFPAHRNRYYQEAQEGLYSGPLFLLSYFLFSLPFSILSVIASSRVAYEMSGLSDPLDWVKMGCIMWGCYTLGEQQTVALLVVVKHSFTAAVASITLSALGLVLSTGVLRSIRGLSEWLLYITYASQPRYAGAYFHRQIFSHPHYSGLARDSTTNCSLAPGTIQTQESLSAASASFGCRYADGWAFLAERFGRENAEDSATLTAFLELDFNMGVTFAFALGFTVINCLLYLVPLPAFIKAKFRE